MLGTFMSPLDATVANVALPSIAKTYDAGVDPTQWVLLSYLLVTTSTLVLFGRLGDMIGQKSVYLLGFMVFGAASFACAYAPSLGFLIASRIVQGLGAAMLMSCTQAIITRVFPANERGRALGYNGAAVAAALSCGPILGGAIVTYAKWQWVFLINVPISIFSMALAAFVLRRELGRTQPFDFGGAALLGTGLLTLSLALSRSHIWGWESAAVWACILYAVIALAAFVRWERRAQFPMVDLRLFTNRTFSFSVAAATLYFCASYALIFIVPLVAQTELHRSGLEAGLVLFPVFALNVVLAPVSGALSDRIRARYLSTIGAAIFLSGLLVLASLPPHPTTLQLTLALVLAGAGTAVFTQPNNNTIMGSAPRGHRGVAAGILATARTTGQLLGIAISGAVYFARVGQLGALAHSYAPAKAVFLTGAAITLAVAVLSYTRD